MTRSQDPYHRPDLYDLEYKDYTEDLEHYVALCRRHRSVLELGCGTGRLTLAIARSGTKVEGVDLSAEMLRQLHRNLQSEQPQIRWLVQARQGDFREIDSPNRFSLIIWPFNALHHCKSQDEIVATLQHAKRLLTADGELALDCYLPDPSIYTRDPDGRHEQRNFVHPDTGERLSSWERSWWEEDKQEHHVVYVYERPNKEQVECHLVLRMYTQEQLRESIGAAGYTIIKEAEDFRGTPVSSKALKWVLRIKPV